MNKIKEMEIYINNDKTLLITEIIKVYEVGGRENSPRRIEIRSKNGEYVFILNNIIGYNAIYE